MMNSVSLYRDKKFRNMRAAKERKRLECGQSEMDEEMRWRKNAPLKDKHESAQEHRQAL
jgi:hypothetical protein